MRGIRGVSARQRNVLAYRLDLLRSLGVRRSTQRQLAYVRHQRALVTRRVRVPAEMWREAARELGDIEVRELAPTLFEFRSGQATARVRGQTTPFADPVSETVASDKPLAYRLLTEAGLSVPEHLLVRVGDIPAAGMFLERVGGPCIVKPARGGGGLGVTGEVRDLGQLRRALVSAGRFDGEALLEQQVAGDSYRLLLLDGEVLDVIRRTHPCIVGDGQKTIEERMFDQYAERIASEGPSGLKPFVVDLDCLFTLERAGYGVTSVPSAGECVTVKTTTNFNGADESQTLEPPYPERFVALARRAAAVLGVRLAGVDLVASGHDDAVVLEVNAVPGLTHHYNVADSARAVRIAVPILASLLQAEGASYAAPGQ